MALEILVNTGNNQPNRSLDIIDDISFSITYNIADISDISTSNGSYTKEIQVPDTANNREIFGFITDMSVDLYYNYNYGLDNSFNPNLKSRCWVLEDSIVIMEGYIQLKGFSYDGVNNNKLINLVIFSDNANFYISLGDSLISDIDFSEFNFTLTPHFVTASWTNDANAWRTGVYFPLQDNGGGLSLNDLNNPDKPISVGDFTPTVYFKTIWDKIHQAHGYNYSSNFLGSNNLVGNKNPDPRFGNLVVSNQQAFQTNITFNQDKIFRVGLTQTTVDQYSHYVGGAVGSTYPPVFVFFHKVAPIVANSWYSGYQLSPFRTFSDRNSYGNSSPYGWTYDQQTINFGNVSSPNFVTTNSSGVPSYTAPFYKNVTSEIFKQRFVLKTDIVTNYSNDFYNYDSDDSSHYYQYIMFAQFYREIDPTTGTTSSAWATGTGKAIPPNIASGVAFSDDRFWICDINGISNCFDTGGQLIVPVGSSRYLGKYCTTELGHTCIEADNSGDANYRQASGDCMSIYDSDGYNPVGTGANPNSNITGLWTSGNRGGQDISTTDQPAWGDWYQQLQLATIFLDGNALDPVYGASASGIFGNNANKPIQPGERVRCVVSFGGKYPGQLATSTVHSYKPPAAAKLVSYIYFDSDGTQGVYNKNVNTSNDPLTVFYNDVSTDYITGQHVDFNDLIPKNIKQKDFIKAGIQMHNLYVEPSKNDPKTLIEEPRDNYYNIGTQSLDWTSKIDLTQPIEVQVLAETQNKETLFTYKNDSDWYNKQYTQLTNEIYGQYSYVLDNDFLTGQNKIESIFSPTPLVELYTFFGDTGGESLATYGGFVLPTYVSGANVQPDGNQIPNGVVQTNYRVLFKNVIQNQNSDTITLFGNSSHTYPYAGPYDNPYTPNYTVNWGQTLGEFFNEATDQFYNNLVNTYWSSLLTEMTDLDSRLVTVQMYLTPYDINNFYFYKLIFLTIDGVDGYYKVNSIEDYIPGKNSTCKVTLLRSNTALTVPAPIPVFHFDYHTPYIGPPIILAGPSS